jgi:hypothetical protein
VKLPDSANPVKQRQIKTRATKALTGDPRAPETHVRRVLSATRVKVLSQEEVALRGASKDGMRPVVSIYRFPQDKRERLVPLGAVVNFAVKLEGSTKEALDVRWTLFNAKTRTHVRKSWLIRRRALRLTADAPVDMANPQIWVPLPRGVGGPFFVRLEIFDDDGGRVNFDDSSRFP